LKGLEAFVALRKDEPLVTFSHGTSKVEPSDREYNNTTATIKP
jgi:hypothetical protein